MREPKKVRTRSELIKSCRGLREHNEKLKKYIKELEAQLKAVKKLINLYFEGCAADTFDDKMHEVKIVLETGDG